MDISSPHDDAMSRELLFDEPAAPTPWYQAARQAPTRAQLEAQTRVPLTDPEWEVYKALLGRNGHLNAIRNAEIQRLSGLDERSVKAAIEGLRLRHGMKIAASREKPYGYFRIETAEELKDFEDAYLGQIVQMLRVLHALRGKRDSYMRELLGQIELRIQGTA